MRTVAAPLDQLAARQECENLSLREWIARFHCCFATHHIEHFVQQFLFVQVEQFLLAALKEFADEFRRLNLIEERGKRLHRNRIRTEGNRLDPEALQQRADLFQRGDLPGGRRQRAGDLEPV